MTALEFLTGFCTCMVLRVAIVNVVGGGLFGFVIGFVPIYTSFMDTNTNCSMYLSENACSTLQHTSCSWNSSVATSNNGICQFATFCDYGSDETICELSNNHDDKCMFDHDAKQCKNLVGWNVVQSGIFAGAMIVGGLIGSLVAGKIVRQYGRKKSLILVGLGSLLASIIIHIASAANIYALIIIGRVIIGAACGLGCVCCPMYVEEMAPEEFRKPIGTLFQVSVTSGHLAAAIVGLALNPTNFYADVHMEDRIQGVCAIQTILSALTIVVGLLIPAGASEDPSLLDDAYLLPVETSWFAMRKPLAIAVVLACAQQMTGINAVVNFAPTISKSVGLKPMVGNLFVTSLNFVTTLVSIPISSRVSMSKMFLVGTICASLSCLCTGIPVFPGVATGDTKHALAGLGIAMFIASFEIGMGPAFYVLSQELFPTHFRPVGSSFTMVTQFFFNIIINISFPIAVQGLSGGPNGNQDKGMAITFIFFGCIGTLCWFVLLSQGLHNVTRSSTACN